MAWVIAVLENRNVEPNCSMSTINNLSDSSNDSDYSVNKAVNNENV